MVKEQKTKLAEVSKLKQETAANLQVKHYNIFPFQFSMSQFQVYRDDFRKQRNYGLLNNANYIFEVNEKSNITRRLNHDFIDCIAYTKIVFK